MTHWPPVDSAPVRMIRTERVLFDRKIDLTRRVVWGAWMVAVGCLALTAGFASVRVNFVPIFWAMTTLAWVGVALYYRSVLEELEDTVDRIYRGEVIGR